MRKLQIETFECNQKSSTIHIPLVVAKSVINLFPNKLASCFEKGSLNLEMLLAAINSQDSQGMIMEIEDHKENEKVILSII